MEKYWVRGRLAHSFVTNGSRRKKTSLFCIALNYRYICKKLFDYGTGKQNTVCVDEFRGDKD